MVNPSASDSQIKSVARLSTRGTEDDGKGTVDILLGVGWKGNTLKPDTIYEIREVLDSLVVVEVGPSAMNLRHEPDTLEKYIWFHNISEIVDCYKERCFLTVAEWEQLCATGNPADNP